MAEVPMGTPGVARTTRLSDLPALTSFPTLGRPVRVVWAEEHTVTPRVIGGSGSGSRRTTAGSGSPISPLPSCRRQRFSGGGMRGGISRLGGSAS
jgi:hypothetical protein